jgi:hypothetical protein
MIDIVLTEVDILACSEFQCPMWMDGGPVPAEVAGVVCTGCGGA